MYKILKQKQKKWHGKQRKEQGKYTEVMILKGT